MEEIDFFHQADFKEIKNISFDTLLLPVFEDDLDPLFSSSVMSDNIKQQLSSLVKEKKFLAKFKKSYFYHFASDIYKNVILLGLGKKGDFGLGTLREALGSIAHSFSSQGIRFIVFDLSYTQKFEYTECIEAVVLAQYQDQRFKSQKIEAPKIEKAYFCIHTQVDPLVCSHKAETAKTVSICSNWARDMANSPSNYLTPSALAEEAKKVVKFCHEQGVVKLNVLGREEIEQKEMGAFYAVSQGSVREPCFINLEYNHKEAKKTLILLGKAVTFDTGGVSLKPSASMAEMKYDMCGGAAVLGVARLVASLGLPIRLITLIPATENAIGSPAIKPGDIVKSYSGKTIEILNTDAEGRLILADALTYACRQYEADYIIDLATLTGACVVALGHNIAALMSNNELLASSLMKAGKETNELLCRLPLNEHYKSLMRGDLADLKNLGPRYAGTITAGAFLSYFIEKNIPWAHLDIAGVAWKMEGASYIKKNSPSAFGVRLLAQWITNLIDNEL